MSTMSPGPERSSERAVSAPPEAVEAVESHVAAQRASTQPAGTSPEPMIASKGKEDDFFNEPDPGGENGPSHDEVEDGFIRRYYMSDEIYTAMGLPEGRSHFLKHFDVDMPTAVVKGEGSGPGDHLRFYYCDFLDSTQHRKSCHRLKDAWREHQKDTKTLLRWVSDLKPRTKLDSYPMMLFMQDMIKELLEDKLDLQLQVLEEAREKIDIMQGDTSELEDQAARMQEDLIRANDTISNLQAELAGAKSIEVELRDEITALGNELKSVEAQMQEMEKEKERLLKLVEKTKNTLEMEKTGSGVTKARVRQIESELTLHSQHLQRWKEHAQEAIQKRALLTTGKDFVPPAEFAIQMMDKAADAGQQCLYQLKADLQAALYRRALEPQEGVGLSDDEIQAFLQLACDLTSSVLQTSSVYIAEILQDKELGNSSRPGSPALNTSEPPDLKFMITAVTGACSFMMGDSLPTTSRTHRHFSGKLGSAQHREPLKVTVLDEWDHLHFFKRDPPRPATRKIMYVAMPFFDASGRLRGYLGADTVGMHDNIAPDLSRDWCWQYMHRVAEVLGQATKLGKAPPDYLESEGPKFFARRAIECVLGRSEQEPAKAPGTSTWMPDFVKDFSIMTHLATQSSNLFLDFITQVPHKTYFNVGMEGPDLDMAKISELRELQAQLQELIFYDVANKREVRFLLQRSKLQSGPSAETVKVWRAAMVILNIHNEEMLDSEPKHAWRAIAGRLDDEQAPVEEQLWTVVKDFNPIEAQTLGNDSIDSRFTLAGDLCKIVQYSALQREGVLQILVLQWVVICIWIRELGKGPAIESAIKMLGTNKS